MADSISAARVSQLIGLIYDCVLEPALWQRAVDELRLAVGAAEGNPAIAHVLPMKHGDVGARISDSAVAAVFVTGADAAPQMPAAALALYYDLTPAEACVF
jgi:hypothetical protein